MKNEGFSAPVRNGKPICADDVHKPVSNGSRIAKQNSSSGVVATTLDTKISITDRTRLGKAIATVIMLTFLV